MRQKNETIIKEALQKNHLFSKLTQAQLDSVFRHCQLQTIANSQILFNQSDSVTAFYLLLTGKIKLFRLSPDGQEKIIEIIKEGDVFAEALMFTNHSDYPVSSAALTTSVVVSINARHFKSMLQGSIETCLLLLGCMSYRLRMLVTEIDTLTLHSATYRVSSYFFEEMQENDKVFKLDVAKNVIATRLSIKPETFSRIIKNLKNQGILSIDGDCVTVHDADALKQFCLI